MTLCNELIKLEWIKCNGHMWSSHPQCNLVLNVDMSEWNWTGQKSKQMIILEWLVTGHISVAKKPQNEVN